MSEIEPTQSPPRLNVNGTPYVLPTLDSFDMDEAMTMYRYSEMTFDQIFELEGLHPGVVAGLLHVAIARSDPALRDKEIKAMVREVNMMDIMEQLAAIADEAPDPTQAEVPSLESDSPTSNDEVTPPSGIASSVSSEAFQARLSPEPTGGPTSDTSADSVPTTSAA